MESSNRKSVEATRLERSNLTHDERAFLVEYDRQLDALVGRLAARPTAPVAGLVRELFRPELWKILTNLRSAEQLADKALSDLNRRSPSEFEKEYERRAGAVTKALAEFGDFVETTRAVSSDKAEWRP